MSGARQLVASDIEVGMSIMPKLHQWSSYGEVLEVAPLGTSSQSLMVAVKRTARSGSTRVEKFGIFRNALVEVMELSQ